METTGKCLLLRLLPLLLIRIDESNAVEQTESDDRVNEMQPVVRGKFIPLRFKSTIWYAALYNKYNQPIIIFNSVLARRHQLGRTFTFSPLYSIRIKKRSCLISQLEKKKYFWKKSCHYLIVNLIFLTNKKFQKVPRSSIRMFRDILCCTYVLASLIWFGRPIVWSCGVWKGARARFKSERVSKSNEGRDTKERNSCAK